MKALQVCGLGIFFFSVSLVLAGGIGIPKKEDVPKYMMQLQSKTSSAADRKTAAEMLGKRGGINNKDVEEAVEPLRIALQKDKDPEVRVAAARALGNIHLDAEKTVPALIDQLKKDEVMKVKLATVVALGQYGADARDALPTMRELGAKFDKKSKDGQTVMANIQLISGAKKKKN